MKNFNFQALQQLGRALMLPIAVLPIAGILLRFGQPDLLNVPAIADAGNTIFTNLPLLFAFSLYLNAPAHPFAEPRTSEFENPPGKTTIFTFSRFSLL